MTSTFPVPVGYSCGDMHVLTTSCLSETLLAEILSYNSAPDLISVLETNDPILVQAARFALSNTITSLHCSYLLQLDRCRNHGSGKKSKNHQEECVAKLLEAIITTGGGGCDDDNANAHGGSEKYDNRNNNCNQSITKMTNSSTNNRNRSRRGTGKLERIEFAGLRHLVGDHGDWLSRIFSATMTTASRNTKILSSTSSRLTSLDFSGCAMLDPRLVHAAIAAAATTTTTTTQDDDDEAPPSVSSIRYLNFQGCYRIDEQIVMDVANNPKFRYLQCLGLGGCSQTIGDDCVHAIIFQLRHLRFLDLSGLKRITEHESGQTFQHLSDTMESLELAGCELLRFRSLNAWSRNFLPHHHHHHHRHHHDGNIRNAAALPLQSLIDPSQLTPNYWEENQQSMMDHNYHPSARAPLKNLSRINFNGIGTPRRGLVEGALSYFAVRSMGALREVFLSGCEQVQDWEIEVLARVCANTLTCLEMRACCIGDDAVRAVGMFCQNLSDVDFSACFQITDDGIVSFCQHQGVYEEFAVSAAAVERRRRANATTTVRSLKIAALPQLTNKSIAAIASLESLLVLDINNCPKVTHGALAETVKDLTSLVDVDAKGIGKWSSSVAALYSYDDELPRYLRFVNGRPFHQSNSVTTTTTTRSNIAPGEGAGGNNGYAQCIVRQYSKRLNHTQGVPLQPMYHCLDCKLIPSLNRGVCHACITHCHKDHETFVGSYTRFYCDCPFGIVCKFECQAISCGQEGAASHHLVVDGDSDTTVTMSS